MWRPCLAAFGSDGVEDAQFRRLKLSGGARLEYRFDAINVLGLEIIDHLDGLFGRGEVGRGNHRAPRYCAGTVFEVLGAMAAFRGEDAGEELRCEAAAAVGKVADFFEDFIQGIAHCLMQMPEYR